MCNAQVISKVNVPQMKEKRRSRTRGGRTSRAMCLRPALRVTVQREKHTLPLTKRCSCAAQRNRTLTAERGACSERLRGFVCARPFKMPFSRSGRIRRAHGVRFSIRVFIVGRALCATQVECGKQSTNVHVTSLVKRKMREM